MCTGIRKTIHTTKRLHEKFSKHKVIGFIEYIFRTARTKQKKILKELREMFHASDIFDKEHYTKILMVRIYTLQN